MTSTAAPVSASDRQTVGLVGEVLRDILAAVVFGVLELAPEVTAALGTT